jgi:hypothetical protein
LTKLSSLLASFYMYNLLYGERKKRNNVISKRSLTLFYLLLSYDVFGILTGAFEIAIS